MRRLLVVLLVIVLPCGARAFDAPTVQERSRQAPPRDRPEPRAGSGQIAGRVTAADSGAPLRQVEITLSSSASGGRRLTRSDGSGQYRFADLPAGRYYARASKPGFVPLRHGTADPLETGRPIDLADGQVVSKIDFSLPRAAVISGQITDEVGEPALDAEVRAMRYQNVQGQRRLTLASRIRLTDDLGAFRLFGLLPGTYYVSAVARGRDAATDAEPESGYAPTYYPGTIDLGQARPVTVSLGGEASVNFSLMAVRTTRVRGTVLDAAGAPATGAQITAVRREHGNTFVTAADARARVDGTFELANLPPGSYTVQAWVRGADDAGRQFGAAPVHLGDADVEGVVVHTQPGGTLRGRVVLRRDGEQVPAPFRPSLIEVAARPAVQDVRLPVGPAARVQSDWTFELRGLSGARILRVSGLPAPWALDSITLAGQDVTDEAIELKPGRVTAGVEIVLTTRATEIAGTVDAPQPGRSQISVIVFSADRAHWDIPSRRVQIRRPDREGKFRIRGLPPGNYLAVAVPYVWQGEWTDPEFLDRASAGATRVTLAEAESKAITLKLATVAQ